MTTMISTPTTPGRPAGCSAPATLRALRLRHATDPEYPADQIDEARRRLGLTHISPASSWYQRLMDDCQAAGRSWYGEVIEPTAPAGVVGRAATLVAAIAGRLLPDSAATPRELLGFLANWEVDVWQRETREVIATDRNGAIWGLVPSGANRSRLCGVVDGRQIGDPGRYWLAYAAAGREPVSLRRRAR